MNNTETKLCKKCKELINKKDLAGFMNYASSEARKLVNNKARFACVEDTTVFGWAIHYFEEDSIEGKLYNLDGTEFTTEVKSKPIEKLQKKSILTPRANQKATAQSHRQQVTKGRWKMQHFSPDW